MADERLKEIAVRSFARADEYAGVWAIEPNAGEALWRHAERLDLPAHMAAAQAAPRPTDSTIERVPGADGKSIALIRLQGLLMKQQSSLGASTSTIQARRDIRAAAVDPNIQAIVIAIDSPGGTAAGSEALANDIRDAGKTKPVFAQIEDIGASAAYFAASQAQKIFASTRTTQVGSIGTYLVVSDRSEAAKQFGEKVHVFATGPLKGAGVPGTEITDRHKSYFQASVEALQVPFDDAVKAGRRMSDAQLEAVKSGAVFTAEESQRLGLIDGIQSLDATLALLTGRPGGKPPTYHAPTGGIGVSAMTFEQYCQARGFNVADLNDKQRAAMEADFAASQKATAIAKPVLPGNDGASLMGDVEARMERFINDQAIRVAELQAVCQEFGNPRVEWNGVTQTVYQHAVKAKLSVDTARDLCKLAKLRDNRPSVSGVSVGSLGANRDLVVQAALEQTARLAGVESRYSDQILQSAHTLYRGRLGPKRLILEAAFANGYEGNIDSVNTDLKKVLQAAFSTVSLPGILSNVVNKVLLAGFTNVEQTWRAITAVKPVNDFKTITSYRMLTNGKFQKVGPGGDLKHATLNEESFTNAADTYGLLVSITRRDIINDDLGAFNQLPRDLGRGAGTNMNEVFWAEFVDNASFFADPSEHYYKGADAVLASAGLTKVLAKFRAKTDPDGNPLAIEPRILLVPPALEQTAKELMVSSNVNTGGAASTEKVPNTNVWNGSYSWFVARYLQNASFGNSSVIWYLLADPQDVPVIETCFLNGNESPTIETADADFATLGVQMRGYFDYGCNKQDARGGVKSKGAA
jgi:signal peptide peptidase SppA